MRYPKYALFLSIASFEKDNIPGRVVQWLSHFVNTEKVLGSKPSMINSFASQNVFLFYCYVFSRTMHQQDLKSSLSSTIINLFIEISRKLINQQFLEFDQFNLIQMNYRNKGLTRSFNQQLIQFDSTASYTLLTLHAIVKQVISA